MMQAEYNAKVQELQSMWGDAASVRTHRDKSGLITEAYFGVYWDGHNHVLGRQRKPFTSDVTYEWDEDEELRLRGCFANTLAHS